MFAVNKRRDDVKKDVLSKLAEIEHMVLCDATKPGGAIPRSEAKRVCLQHRCSF